MSRDCIDDATQIFCFVWTSLNLTCTRRFDVRQMRKKQVASLSHIMHWSQQNFQELHKNLSR
jgi:hypothetical protein